VEVQDILGVLGKRIRELRLKRGYSQEAFADLCGVHRTFMGTVERGESNISFSNLVKISTALGVTLSEMLSGLEKRAARPTGDGATSARSEKPRDVPQG
jgi:transcriptional regulator with XRE-family HTH domain